MIWRVERRRGPAGELHARPVGGRRLVELLEVSRPALVLGSRQSEDEVDEIAAKLAGVEVARRGSGGGAVLLLPYAVTWIDLTIARDDPLWTDDVGRAFGWVGDAWADALRSFDLEPEVHTGRLRDSRWSSRICFAGLGPGEVTVDGQKLLGIAQRRTREGARFQCLVHRRWEPRRLVELLAMSPDERASAAEMLEPVATGLDVEADQLLNAVVSSLP